MNKSTFLKIAIAVLFSMSLISFTMSYMADPPIVSDITVCEGGSTVIIPMSSGGGGSVTEEIASETFDGNGLGYTASIQFNDGSNDHFNLTDGSDISNVTGPYSFESDGNLFWAAEDTDDNGGDGMDEQSLTFNAVDITNFSNIEFCIEMAAGNENLSPSNYDLLDHVFVEYSFDAINYNQGLCFNSALDGDNFNSSFHHDPDCDGDGIDGVQLVTTAANYCFTIPAIESAGQTNLTYRILVFLDSASEEVAFDNIVITGETSIQGAVTFNYYDEEPIIGTTTPIVVDASSYDPMTTPATSPDTIWVTADDGVMESTASQVIVTVNANPNAEAGPTGYTCGLNPISLNADTIAAGVTGTWSGGLGSFDDETSAVTNYNPDASELGGVVELTWSVSSTDCGDATDIVYVYSAIEAPDAEFSYFVDTICPGDGSLFPIHTTGVDGLYELIEGNEDSISLNPMTGEINLSESGMGTFTIQNTTSACGNLMISGIIDGPLTGGIPKAIELYAANDIADLSDYSLGSANNGGGTDGEEFMFPQVGISAGTFLFVASDSVAFEAWFGFKPDFVSTAALINGDDAIELFCNGEVIDLFGDINVDGSGEPWEYLDGWAYRVNNESINLAGFNPDNWIYSGINVLDGESDNATAVSPFPNGTFTTGFTGICPNNTFTSEITIGDFDMPIISCPSDMTITLDPGDCGAFAQLFDPIAMDNCSDTIIFTQISGPENGDYLDKENSPYEIVYEGEEMNGNILTCSYTITVEEYQSPTSTLACNGFVNISLDESCGTLITADMLLEGGAYGCYEDFGIQVTLDGNTVGAVVDNDYGTGYSVYLDAFYLGETLEVSVIEIETGNSCWGNILLEDKFAPQFENCDPITISCGEDTSPVPPALIDNCGDAVFDMDEDIIEGTCQDTFSIQIVRTWQVADLSGNMGEECTQIITVLKDTFSNLELPLSYDGITGNNNPLSCDGAGIEFAIDPDGLPSPTAIGSLPGTGEPTLGAGCSDIISYYSDDVIQLCGISYKVLRNWTIIDWCTGEVVEYIQVIKVLDQEGPVFNSPDDLTVAANAHCHGEFQLPLIPASDNCGTASVYFTSEFGEIDNGFFYVDELTLNSPYTVSAIGVDECGNENIQEFKITFVDLTPPVVNAETSLTVSLSADGTAKLFAESFDDGSYDGCSDVGFSIIRMFSTCDPIDYDEPAGDDNFQLNDVVHFCCSDVDEPQMVTFRVCDDADGNDSFGSSGDNCNTAMVEVIVQDKLPPIIECPAPVTINCVDAKGIDFSDYDLLDGLFGEASVEYACSANLTQSAIPSTECGSGIVFRTFTASNSITSVSCTQIITINAFQSNTLTCNRIRFADFNNSIYNWCAINDNVNDNDDDIPAISIPCDGSFEVPALDIDIDGLCTEVGEKVTIDTFNFANGACKKYLLHYEVIDQCIFDDNFVDPITGEVDPYHSGNGYFEFYLEIDAFDNTPPEFDPVDVSFTSTFCDQGSVYVQADATDNCTAAENLTYSYRIDYFSDGSFDFPTSGYVNNYFIASGVDDLVFIPIGEHNVYWIIDDGCGNKTTRVQKLSITPNTKAPTPYCKTGFKASISAMGMLTITADEFDAGSFDNCDAQEDLVFSFSPDVNDTEKMFTCDDLGYQFIQVYVTDLDGNQDFCNTSFLVQDNGNFCSNTLVVGSVESDGGYKNNKAQVIVHDGSQIMTGMETDTEGEYFINPSNYSDEAMLEVIDDNGILMGVTTLDIITIQKHILGIKTLPTNTLKIAADVDNNGKISGADIIQVRKVILGHQFNFKNNHSWVVIPSSIDIESLNNPFEYTNTLNVVNAESYDWNSIKVADVNMSHNELKNNDSDTRSTYDIEYLHRKDDNLNMYEFYGNPENLVGLDMTINSLSMNDFVKFEGGAIKINDGNYSLSENGLKISWSDLNTDSKNLLFSLITEKDIDIEAIQQSIAYTGKGVITSENNVEIREKGIEVINSEVIFDVYPNPFNDELFVNVNNISLETAELSILDNNGSLIHREILSVESLTLTSGKFPTSGIYYIQIDTGTEKLTKKVIKIE